MGIIRKPKKIENFKREFAPLLRRSFDDLLIYLEKRYNRKSLPVYRSPQQRHAFFVATELRSNNKFENLDRRSRAAIEDFTKNEFIASLTAPFDHIPVYDEAEKKLSLFLEDIEDLSDDQFNLLLKYLDYTKEKIILEKIIWWLKKSFPRIFLNIVTISTGVLILFQSVFGFNLISGVWNVTLFSFAISVDSYTVILISLLSLVVITSWLIIGFSGIISRIFMVMALPIYAIWELMFFFTRKIYNIAYESIFIREKRYRIRNVFSNIKFITFIIFVDLVSSLSVFLTENSLITFLGIVFTFTALTILLIWFYYWNFQPLLFLETGLRLYFTFRLYGIDKKLPLIKKKSIKSIRQTIFDLELSKNYCKRMKGLLSGIRFNVFGTNSFIALFIIFFIFVIFQFSIIYWGVYKFDPQAFNSSLPEINITTLKYTDFLRLSFNNLPIGGNSQLSTTKFVVDILMFCERFMITLILVISIFAYSIFSNEQIEASKQEIKDIISYEQRSIWSIIGRYKQALKLKEGVEETSSNSVDQKAVLTKDIGSKKN